MSSGPNLRPREHAVFSVLSRLVSCLVTEQILLAFYISLREETKSAAGLMVVLSIHTTEYPKVSHTLHSDNIFAIIPLYHLPVLKGHLIYRHGQLIALVDPLDMIPFVYEFVTDRAVATDGVSDDFTTCILDHLALPPWNLTKRGRLQRVRDPVALWNRFSDSVAIQEELRQVIGTELRSSVDWQTLAYKNPPLCPNLYSKPIEWEQSLVAGHPTHPMHRARMLPYGNLDYDWYHPQIHFIRVSRSRLDLYGAFATISSQLSKLAAQKAGHILLEDEDIIYMPVHELQIENIIARFQDVEVLHPDIKISAFAQSSIRTVVVSELPELALKLSVGVKISSSLRTISHFTAEFGPRFSTEVIPKLSINPSILAIELEPASAVYRADPEIAKHFTAVIREEYQAIEGEVVIVCAALLEMGHQGVPPGVAAVEHVFKLDSGEKKTAFLDRYIQLACEAMLPSLIHNGVAFEAHAQNVLLRVDVSSGELRGFVIRDLGGLRIHPSTLRASTGVDFEFRPGHAVATKTLEDIYPKFYHTFIHNHIQRLIRVLGQHYNGHGWEMLRRHMESMIPQDHLLRKVWLDSKSTSVNSKCLMRMRMCDSYRDMILGPYPNMIQYRP